MGKPCSFFPNTPKAKGTLLDDHHDGSASARCSLLGWMKEKSKTIFSK
jgi:hypothetical protein